MLKVLTVDEVLATRVMERFALTVLDKSRGKLSPFRAPDGQFMHSKLTRLCKNCGHPVGMHTADKGSDGSRPCVHGDFHDDSCECPVFVPSDKFLSDEDYEQYSRGRLSASDLRELRAYGSKTDDQLKALWSKYQ